MGATLTLLGLERKKKTITEAPGNKWQLFLIKLEVIKLISFDSQWAMVFCVQGLF